MAEWWKKLFGDKFQGLYTPFEVVEEGWQTMCPYCGSGNEPKFWKEVTPYPDKEYSKDDYIFAIVERRIVLKQARDQYRRDLDKLYNYLSLKGS